MNKLLSLTSVLLASTVAYGMDASQKREFMINASRIASGQNPNRLLEKLREIDKEEMLIDGILAEEKRKKPDYDSDSDSAEEVSLTPMTPLPLPIIPFPTVGQPGQNVFINYNIQVTQNLRNSKGKVKVNPEKINK